MDDLKDLREQKERIEAELAARKRDAEGEKEYLRRWIEFNGEIPCK